MNVFEAARRADVGKVVYAESSALYEGSQTLPTPESDVHPQSFYAVSKLAGMAFAEAYRRFYGLRTTALRYSGLRPAARLPPVYTTGHERVHHQALAR